ncbi:MAG: ABC transporter permease [Desulfobacterales bacterium]|nr:ABC transporter permease [Desulfobacterales bacterium]MCP4163318.1 ABC transporter permease [Deltaproteobacteria bacterium]
MLQYVVKRILLFIPTIFFISLIMFFILNVLPGDATTMSGGLKRQLDEQTTANMRKQLGLDQPLHIRYFKYMKGIVKGDFGKSYLRNESVNLLISERIMPTLQISLAAILIAVGIGIPLGFISALKQGSWIDTLSMVTAVSGVSIPQFWLGLILMYVFSLVLNWLPPQGYGDGGFMHMIMPSVTLGVGYMALIARTTRAAVIEVLNEDFVRTARAKGISELAVNYRHVFKNTLILILTTVGLQFGSLVGQTVIVEKLFSWPGIGSLLVDSIFQRDIPVTQGCVLVIIGVFLIVNLVIDLLYVVIDPRIKYTESNR